MTFLFPHLAAPMIPFGLAMLVLGIRRAAAGLRRYDRDPARALALLRGFRISIVGLCMAGVGAGLVWDIGWLVGLSLIIGGEELLESTVVITAMTHGVSPRSDRSTSSPVPVAVRCQARGDDRLTRLDDPFPANAERRAAPSTFA